MSGSSRLLSVSSRTSTLKRPWRSLLFGSARAVCCSLGKRRSSWAARAVRPLLFLFCFFFTVVAGADHPSAAGIGEAVALRLAQAKASVFVVGRNAEHGRSVVERMVRAGRFELDEQLTHPSPLRKPWATRRRATSLSRATRRLLCELVCIGSGACARTQWRTA